MSSTDPQERSVEEQPEVLIIGTMGGGGIHRYVDAQCHHLEESCSVELYDAVTPRAGDGAGRFLRGFIGALRAAGRFPFRSPPDIVHAHTSHRFSFYRMAFYVLFCSYVWRCPVVLHVHGSSFDEFVTTDSQAVRLLQSVVFGASDRIVVLSEYWKDVLAPHVEEQKLRIFPNAVSPDRYDPTFDVDPPHVVFVSNLVERKGVAELVSALESLASSGVSFRASIAGDGYLRDTVTTLAARHENIEYLGYVSERQKHDLLNEGSVFVLPTYAEGLPIAMLEAMAGGNAVVTTTVGSIPEVISRENGRLVEPGDEEQLADALASLLQNPAEIEAMARRNRTLIEERYQWSRTTERLETLYAEALRDQRVPTS